MDKLAQMALKNLRLCKPVLIFPSDGLDPAFRVDGNLLAHHFPGPLHHKYVVAGIRVLLNLIRLDVLRVSLIVQLNTPLNHYAFPSFSQRRIWAKASRKVKRLTAEKKYQSDYTDYRRKNKFYGGPEKGNRCREYVKYPVFLDECPYGFERRFVLRLGGEADFWFGRLPHCVNYGYGGSVYPCPIAQQRAGLIRTSGLYILWSYRGKPHGVRGLR